MSRWLIVIAGINEPGRTECSGSAARIVRIAENNHQFSRDCIDVRLKPLPRNNLNCMQECS
jgi:hypothetical protein